MEREMMRKAMPEKAMPDEEMLDKEMRQRRMMRKKMTRKRQKRERLVKNVVIAVLAFAAGVIFAGVTNVKAATRTVSKADRVQAQFESYLASSGAIGGEIYVDDFDGDGEAAEGYAYIYESESSEGILSGVSIVYFDDSYQPIPLYTDISGYVGNNGRLLDISGTKLFVWEAADEGSSSYSLVCGWFYDEVLTASVSGTHDMLQGVTACATGADIQGYADDFSEGGHSYVDTYYNFSPEEFCFYETTADGGNSASSTSGLILPNISTEVIDDVTIQNLTDQQLRYAINDIFAIHGRKFVNSQVRSHYEALSWYKGTCSDKEARQAMTVIEKSNLRKLVAEQKLRAADPDCRKAN